MINYLPLYMITSLTCTIIIEVIVSLFLGFKNKKDILNVVLVNVLTNPLLVSLTFTIYIYFGLKVEYISIAILELLVILIEAIIYKKTLKFNKINYFIISLILNFCSYFLGILINNFLW